MADEHTNDTSIICYAPSMITTNGVWQGDNPLDFSLPLFVLQLTLVVLVTRFFVFVLKPFRQPRVISEILVRKPKNIYISIFKNVILKFIIDINFTGRNRARAIGAWSLFKICKHSVPSEKCDGTRNNG